jgi:hypothetical protein
MKYTLNLNIPWHAEALLALTEQMELMLADIPSPNYKFNDLKGDFGPDICQSWEAMHSLKLQFKEAYDMLKEKEFESALD